MTRDDHGRDEAEEPADSERPEAVRNQYDWRTTPPSIAVVEAVARATDRDPTDLEHLHSWIDTDALDAVLTPGQGLVEGSIEVAFSFMDYEVTIDSDGSLSVTSERPGRE